MASRVRTKTLVALRYQCDIGMDSFCPDIYLAMTNVKPFYVKSGPPYATIPYIETFVLQAGIIVYSQYIDQTALDLNSDV